jgi:hypothetical protein
VTFNIEIFDKKEKENVVFDALSWKDEELISYKTLFVVPKWLNEIQVKYAKDPKSCSIINNLGQTQN